ncbi:PAS domain S-box protein [Candidatus Neomarinimicrobiota bacterium]
MSKNKFPADLDKRLNSAAARIEKLQQALDDKQWIIEKTDVGLKALYGELQKANKELEKQKSSLEVKICERTKKLTELNRALEQELAERKQVEEALQYEKDLLDSLMNNSLDNIYFKDRQCRLLRINNMMLRSLNLDDMNQVIGKTDIDLFGEEFGRKTIADDQHLMKIGEPIIGLIESKRLENGGINWTSTTKVPLRDTSGEIIGLVGITREINDIIKAEEALRNKHEDVRGIIDSSLDMIIAVDNKRRITEFNHAAEETFGYSREKVLGKHVNILYADPKEGLAVYRNTVLNGHHVQEIINRRKNGETFPCLLSSSVLLDPSGERVGVMGVSRDIAQSKQDEELLQFQANILSSVRDSVIVTDLEDRIIYWNTGATELYGYTADEMIGQSVVVLSPDQDPEKLAEDLRDVMQGNDLTGTWKGRRSDGSYIWIAIKTTLARDAAGNPIGFISVSRNITQRKRVEEKLKLSDEIISHIENLVLVFNERGKVIFTGPSVTRVLGYSITELLGDGWFELTSQDDTERNAEKAYITAAITDKAELRREPYERRIYDKEGRSRWILWQDAQGLGNTLIGIGHDITQYKNLELQLIQGEKLRAVGELAAGIAHEINSPIQFIGDNLHFLKDANQKTIQVIKEYKQLEEIEKGAETFSGVLDSRLHDFSIKDIAYYCEEIPKAIEQSLEGVGRITNIVQAMRTFSHPGGEEKIPVDINQAIQSTVIITRNEWKYVANVELDFFPDLAPVPCLAGEINQVFLNLVVNAAQALQEAQESGVSQEKGTITISTRPEEDEVVVRINDTGPGIPEEIRPRIFEPFFTTKGVGSGTGQGLAIAHAVVVEKHGGNIYFETEEDKGTTFIVRLPLHPVEISNRRGTIS